MHFVDHPIIFDGIMKDAKSSSLDFGQPADPSRGLGRLGLVWQRGLVLRKGSDDV
jgi:hypothetical protein